MKKIHVILPLICLPFYAFPQDTLTQNTPWREDRAEISRIIDKYINAIGGRETLSSVNNRVTTMSGKVQGFDIKMIVYQKAPYLLRQEITASGLDQVIIFDGENGIMKLGDNKMNITGDELEKLKYESMFNLVLNPDSAGIEMTLLGSPSDSAGVYTIRSTAGNISWITTYDAVTGLRIMEEKEVVTPSGTFTQQVKFSNYREVDDIKYPFTIEQTLGSQTMNFSVSSVKINQELDGDLFDID